MIITSQKCERHNYTVNKQGKYCTQQRRKGEVRSGLNLQFVKTLVTQKNTRKGRKTIHKYEAIKKFIHLPLFVSAFSASSLPSNRPFNGLYEVAC